MKRFIYFYINRDAPEKIRQVVPAHVQYWKNANVRDYLGGPFVDRTGGLISFAASILQEAIDIIQLDPFILEDVIEQHWGKEWLLD